jgi:ubiquinone/menaquinone biosynthesis C-methylase UbiE
MNKGKAPRLLSKVKRVVREKGIRYVVLAGIRKTRNRLTVSFWYNYYRIFKSWRKLRFQQKEYKYFYHKYNTTWRNERVVEIPIVWDIVKAYTENILEVGNVLSHYFAVNHVIIDKYEKPLKPKRP